MLLETQRYQVRYELLDGETGVHGSFQTEADARVEAEKCRAWFANSGKKAKVKIIDLENPQCEESSGEKSATNATSSTAKK